MLRKLLITTSCLGLGLAVSAKTFDPVTLAWKPQVGTVLHYVEKASGQIAGQDTTFSANQRDTVKAINADGTVVVDETVDNLSIVAGGVDVSNQAPTAITSTITSGIDGHLIKKVSDQGGDSARVDSLSQFVFPDHPVNVGDTWSYKGKADQVKKTFDFEIDYVYQGPDTADGIASNKVSITFKELNVPDGTEPMTGSGTAWIDASTGDPVKISFAVKNAVMGPMPPADMSFTLDRK